MSEILTDEQSESNLNQLLGIDSGVKPPVDPPPADPPKGDEGGDDPPKGDIAVFDFKSAGFETPESVTERLSAAKKFEEETVTLRQGAKTFEDQLKAANNNNQFHDPVLYKLNQIKLKDPDNYNLALRLHAMGDGVSEKELLKLNFLENNPGLAGESAEDLEKLILGNFKLSHNLKALSGNDPETQDPWIQEKIDARNAEISKLDEDVRLSKLRMKADAGTAKKELMSKFEGNDMPAKVDEVTQKGLDEKKLNEFTATWRPGFEEIKEGFKNIEISTIGEKDASLPFLNVEVPEEEGLRYLKEAAQLVLGNNLEFTAENVQSVKDYMYKNYVADNLPKLIHQATIKARDLSNEEWIAQTFNAKPPGKTDQAKIAGGNVNTNEANIEKILANS